MSRFVRRCAIVYLPVRPTCLPDFHKPYMISQCAIRYQFGNWNLKVNANDENCQ